MKCSPTTRNHCGQRRARGRGRGRGTGREREGEGEGDGDGEGVGDIFIDAEKSRLEQIVGKDWVKIIEGHSNQAHTTLKFFMAGKSDKKNSDYHENFTFEETVKIYVATALAWPDFCLHNQLLQNKGRLAKDDGKRRGSISTRVRPSASSTSWTTTRPTTTGSKCASKMQPSSSVFKFSASSAWRASPSFTTTKTARPPL